MFASAKPGVRVQLSSVMNLISFEDRTTLQQSDGDERLSRQVAGAGGKQRRGRWSSLRSAATAARPCRLPPGAGKKIAATCASDWLPWACESVRRGSPRAPPTNRKGAWIIGYHLAADLRDELGPLLDGLNALSQGGGQEVAAMAQDQRIWRLAADPLRAAKRLRIGLAGSASIDRALKPSLEKDLGSLGHPPRPRRPLCRCRAPTPSTVTFASSPPARPAPMGHSVCKLQVALSLSAATAAPAVRANSALKSKAETTRATNKPPGAGSTSCTNSSSETCCGKPVGRSYRFP